MQLRPFLHHLLQRSALLLAAAVLPVAALAQTTGTIVGRVSDAATGKSLQGAIVRVLGTPITDYSRADGRYTLSAVPAGAQRLQIDYVGLDAIVQNVTVAGGAIATLDVTLASAALKLEAFTVAESVRGQALAVNQQKTARGIVNIVSEETFGSMVSGNIGYALQRLPGLTVNEDEDGTPSGVNIRGMESKYNSFQIDGNRLPTSGSSRGFSTNQLSGDGISNIEVIKAATPDRDGDAIGGIINVISRSAFERDGRSVEVTGSGLYYGKYEKLGYNAGLTYLDLLSVGGGEKNLGFALNLTSYETSRNYDNIDKDYALIRPANDPQLGLTQPTYFHTNGTPQTNERDTRSNGASLSLDYRLSNVATFYLRPFYTKYTVKAEKPRNRFYINSNHAFGNLTGTKSILAATYNTGSTIASRTEEIRYQNEQTESDNNAYGLSLGGKHQLDTITLTYDGFYSANEASRTRSLAYIVRNPGYNISYDQSVRSEPNYTITNGKDPFDLSAVSRGDLTVNPNEAEESATSIKADLEKKFVGAEVTGALKFGAKYRVNEKEQDATSRTYRTGTAASGFNYGSLMKRSNRTVFGTPMTLEPDINKVEALFNTTPALFVLDANAAASASVVNDFKAEEDIAAAYAMGTLVFGRTTLIAGFRAEQNTFESSTFRFNSTAPNAPTRVRSKRTYTVGLPGIHLRHALRPNLIVRESYNRSYARPDIDRLVAGLTLDVNTGNISGGNPNLSESTSDNYDVQVEYYTAKGGLYSAGLFYKDVKGFYYQTTQRFNTTDADGYPIIDPTGALVYSTTLNALGAVNYGVELIARQKLFFLPKPFDGFGVGLSATFTESDGKYPGRLAEKLPTYGFSDTIFNASLEYAAEKFRAQLNYTYRSDYLEGLDVDNTFDDYFGAYESLNWESSYQLNKQLKLFFNVNNLMDEPQISYQGFKRTDNPEDYTTYSWRATFGATYKF